ncbi:hypothetical protein CEXT_499971 [Caerostris extrusa]|uniref:Uncharacterized protein n=1 Tax=Caerostris extrusa TaxID=172846 RepID=A0AAV4SYG9_CAEEX|nr:hypothetical protein CEXT_499971 [Caerostris extrusa]
MPYWDGFQAFEVGTKITYPFELLYIPSPPSSSLAVDILSRHPGRRARCVGDILQIPAPNHIFFFCCAASFSAWEVAGSVVPSLIMGGAVREKVHIHVRSRRQIGNISRGRGTTQEP